MIFIPSTSEDRGGVQTPAPGALRELFRDFKIMIDRELDDYGEWGGPPTPHVRMVDRKSE